MNKAEQELLHRIQLLRSNIITKLEELNTMLGEVEETPAYQMLDDCLRNKNNRMSLGDLRLIEHDLNTITDKYLKSTIKDFEQEK